LVHAHSKRILRIKQLPNGYVATCAYDYKVKIWNTSTWNSTLTYEAHTANYVYALEYINSDLMASGDADGTVNIWNISTGETIYAFKLGSGVQALQLLSDNLNLAIGLSSGMIDIYDLSNANLIVNLTGHKWSVEDLITINTDLLASSSRDQTIKIWNLTTNKLKFTLKGHANNVYRLKLVSSEIIASGSDDNTIKLWNITSGLLVRTLSGHAGSILMSVDLLSLEILVSGSEDLTIKLWNTSTSECLQTVNTSFVIHTLAVLNSSLTATNTCKLV
jgi:WD40 repeat protein